MTRGREGGGGGWGGSKNTKVLVFMEWLMSLIDKLLNFIHIYFVGGTCIYFDCFLFG